MTPLNNLSIKDLDWPCLSDMDREPVYQRVAPIHHSQHPSIVTRTGSYSLLSPNYYILYSHTIYTRIYGIFFHVYRKPFLYINQIILFEQNGKRNHLENTLHCASLLYMYMSYEYENNENKHQVYLTSQGCLETGALFLTLEKLQSDRMI